jgi:hypothetical protein
MLTRVSSLNRGPWTARSVIVLTLSGFLTFGTAACTSPSGGAPSIADTPTGSTSDPASGAPSPGSSTSPAAGSSATPAPGPGGGSGQIASGSPITITRTGGLVGYQQILKIAEDGSWTLIDRKTDVTQRGTMTAAQRQELTRLLADPAFPREARQAPAVGTCNDSVVFTVTVGELSSRYDQCGGSTNRPATSKIVSVAIDATAM